MESQKRFFLQEKDIPTQWYNIVADMKTKPLPMLNPGTRKPIQWTNSRRSLPVLAPNRN